MNDQVKANPNQIQDNVVTDNVITEEMAQQMAERAAVDREFYQGFVRNLASDPMTYNDSAASIQGLFNALQALTPHSLILDHHKRVLTYGEKLRINPPHQLQQVGAEAEGHQFAEYSCAHALMIHGILGIITEALELAPILSRLLAQAPVDLVNLKEELGDLEWYEALVEQSAAITHDDIIKSNVRKLAKRYKGGRFSAQEALNRNLHSERDALDLPVVDAREE